MKNFKKLSLVGMMSVLALAGCDFFKKNGGGNDTKTGDQVGHFDHEVTIKFVQAYGQGYQATLQNYVNKFNEIEPNVKIDLEAGWLSGNYDTIHNTTISDITSNTGEYGDLVIAYADHCADYLNYGKLVKLDPYMENSDYGFTQEELDDIVPGFLEEGRTLPATGTWALPFSKSTEAMYYNKTRLIGLDLSAYDATINDGNPLTEAYINNLTWEELFGKLCPAFEKYDIANPDQPLTVKTGDGKSLDTYVGYDSDSNLFITLAEQYGYGYTAMDDYGEPQINFNNDNMKGLVKTFADAAAKKYISTPACIGASYSSSYFTAMNTLFSIGSTAGVKNQNSSEFDVGVARIPQAAGRAAKIISQGPSLCILDHGDADRKLAAWLFYKFISNAENSAIWATTVGYLPVRQSSYESEVYFEYCDSNGKTARSLELLSALNAQYSANNTQYCFSTPAFKGSSTARTQVGAVMTNMLKKSYDGDVTTLEDIQTALNNAESNTLLAM